MFSNKGQDSLLKLRSALGHSGLDRFAASKEGICRGVSQTAINAFVLEKSLEKEDKEKQHATARQNEFKKYLDRIDFILKFYNSLSQLITDIKRQIIKRIEKEKSVANGEITKSLINSRKISEDERKILEVASLIDSMQIFAYPDKYHEVFGKPLTQKDIQEISYYAQPYELEMRSVAINTNSLDFDQTNRLLAEARKQSGIIITDTTTGVYDQDELKKYIAIITNLVESNPCDLAIGIDNDEHAISIFYDATKKTWTVVDAENLSERKVTSDELASRISSSLPFTFDPIKVFSMKFFTSVNRKIEMEIFVNKLKSSSEFIALHEVTRDRAIRSDLKGLTLAYLAASENNISLINDLSNFKDSNGLSLIDFNRPIGDGTTPLFMAIQNGCADVVLLLANLRDSNGKRIIDLNKITKYKQGDWNPIFLAAQKNQAEVVKVLASLKNPDGTFVIDFNQLINGESPLFTATQYGVDALRVLVDLKVPNGRRVLDVNKPIPGGRTPLFIAANSGQLDAFKILCELRKPDGTYEIDVNQPLRWGKKALHIAANEGHLNIIKYLATHRDFSIDLDEPDNEGLTPAHIASANNKVDVLILLDKLGANVEKDISGKKPIDFAKYPSVLTFYQALNKRNELVIKLEHFKNMINEIDFVNLKTNIINDFYEDPNTFLKTNKFTEMITSLEKTDVESRRAHGFFASTNIREGEDTSKQVLNSQPFEYQMELLTQEKAVTLTFKSSLVIKLEQTSIDPVIWHLMAESDDDKKTTIAINNVHLISNLLNIINDKNLPAFLELLKEQQGRSYKTISKQVIREVDYQHWVHEQNIATKKTQS